MLLVADHERAFAESLAVALEARDLEILDEYPSTGLDAVKTAVTRRPNVVLLDYWLDGMQGPAATRFILKHFPETSIIILSWFFTGTEIAEATRAGAKAFIPKSYEVGDVANAVRQVHRSIKQEERSPKRSSAHPPIAKPVRDEGWERLLSLTPREIEILGLLAFHSVEEIAEMLSVRLGTVRNHIQSVLNKTGARTQLEALDFARTRGVV